MSRQGIKTAVMFVIHNPNIKWFMPDYHTDISFSQTLLKVRNEVDVIPVSIGFNNSLELLPDVNIIKIPWEYIEKEAHDRGAYLLILQLKRAHTIKAGSLSRITLKKGWYVYVGSAMKNLSKRIERHMRLRKQMHWHIDWLRQVADCVTALPIRSSEREECNIAKDLRKILRLEIEGFGASDCKCSSHLFYTRKQPQSMRDFHNVLEHYRMSLQ